MQGALYVPASYVTALGFRVYGYVQGGQDAEAKRGVERGLELQKKQGAAGIANPTGAVLAPYTALAAIPARYAIERGAWAEAAGLQPAPTTPVADAITYFARAMGSARSGGLESARKDIEQLRRIKDELVQSKQDYWAQQVEIQRSAAAPWVASAEGKKVETLKLIRSPADPHNANQHDLAI